MFRFLPGIIIVQVAAIALFLLLPQTSATDYQEWLKLAVPLLLVAVLVAFWFNSIATIVSKDKLSRMKEKWTKEQETLQKKYEREREDLTSQFSHEKQHLTSKFAQERERLRVNAERSKIKVIKESQKQMAVEAKRVHSKANFKVGASLAGAIGAGVVMLLLEFMTMGLMMLTTAGGVGAGYVARMRQEKSDKSLLSNIKIPKIKVLPNKKESTIDKPPKISK